jgi:protein phosphatase methylesterase 1
MSDIQKAFAKAKLSALPPPEPPHDPDDDSSSASSISSTGTIRPTFRIKPAQSISWTDFFAQELYLEQKTESGPSAKYHVYLTPPCTPKDALLVLHHGAGSSPMSFALCAAEVRSRLPNIGILAVSAREHGSVVWDAQGAVDTDMTIDTLSNDLVSMIRLTVARMGWSEVPRLLLVGHSLGGAVVVHTAKSFVLGTKVIGFGVMDVVEGSALEALKYMQSYLATRPAKFKSLETAIEWHVRSRTLRNYSSARASVPSLFFQNDEGEWVWRTDLSKTQAYWENWFGGMSGKFLSARGAKMLILAGTDRLDKELMIGQMQGKDGPKMRNKRGVLNRKIYRQIPASCHTRSGSLCTRGRATKDSVDD